MSTLLGAAGMFFIMAGFYLCPEDRSPVMMSLPWKMQAAVVTGVAALFIGGMVLIAAGIINGLSFDEPDDKKEEEKSA